MSVRRLLLAAIACAAALPAGSAAAATVHLRGTAYEFNTVKVRLAGARILVAENPALGATARADGSYDLAVPDHATITPYIVAAGHHTIYLQTFRTDGQDLDRVNFQTPTEDVYRALAALLNVPLTPDGQLAQCAIVSTFSTRNVRDLPFDGFTAYGAHGVAGATAFATPALPPPVYFNASVIPDRSQTASSKDGGVIWSEVPAGTYTIAARSTTTRFASFVATCAPGRIVNANPPWGLHELGLPNPARVTIGWDGARVRALRAVALPRGATVTLSCQGGRCPFAARAFRPAGSRLDLLARLGSAARRLRASQTIGVLVTAHAHDGKLVRAVLRSGHRASPVTRCVPLGETKPRARC